MGTSYHVAERTRFILLGLLGLTSLTLPCLAQTGCITPPPGLVAWWAGDGNANDLVGVNNGALQNGTTFAAGRVGQSFAFDGMDDSVSFGNAIGNFGTNNFSIAFWVQ